MSLQDACMPWAETKCQDAGRAETPPGSKEENIYWVFREEHSSHSFNHYITLMTGPSHCLSSLQNFLLPSPHLHLPYWLWRFHLQLLTEVLSIWKTMSAEPKVPCGATVLSKLLLTSFIFLTSSLGLFLVAIGSPSSNKRWHRASLAVQGAPQQRLVESNAVTSLVYMSWKKT